MSAETHTSADQPSRAAARTGLVLMTLVTLFFVFDFGIKLLRIDIAVQGTVALGFPEYAVTVIGVLLLIGVILYVIPRTAVFGAVYITAYLGGAVCANLRAELPLFGYILSPVYMAVLMWLGLYLRSPGLRALVRAPR